MTGQAAGIVAWTTDSAVFASRWKGQAFSQATAVTDASTIPREPRALLARDGRATVEWHAGPFDPCRPTTPRYASTLRGSGPPAVPVTISPPNGTQGQFVSALDDDGRPVRAWLQATSIGRDKYGINCWFPTMRVGASIDGGPTIHGPEVKPYAQLAFAADPVRTPMLVWREERRILFSTLPPR